MPHGLDHPPAALRWLDPPEGPAVALLDQTRLPLDEVVVVCGDVPGLVDAIRRLVVRGAPLLGIAGGYGVALAALRGEDVRAAARALASARPTAVNLGWGVRRVLTAFEDAGGGSAAARAALEAARAIEAEDAAACAAIGAGGLPLVPAGARVLTHCNTGRLVTAGDGTAYGIILAAHRAGRLAKLWVDETRPLLQGSRLTAYEATRDGVPHAVLPDGAAGVLLARGEVDLVLVGADRIAADGSVANKVGTYTLAVLARHHGVPLVVAAPTSTVDLNTPDGDGIVTEQRGADEVRAFAGTRAAPATSPVYNPAFDVTPPGLVSAIVTERGIVRPVDRESLCRLCNCEPNDMRR